jgi:hypothetical protein
VSSLKYHEALNHGLTFTIRRDDDNFHPYLMRLRLKRKNNAYCLMVGDKEFKLSNSNKLIDWSNLGNKSEVYFTELFQRIQELIGANKDQMIELFREGVQEQKIAEEKAEALLQKAIKLCEAEKKKETFDHNEVEGYVVKGKLRTYFLTEDLKVYDYNSRRYICIVDRTQSMRVHKDKIANRLYVLRNDTKVINAIATLNY